MLLGLNEDDSGEGKVPEGSTVMEAPVLPAAGNETKPAAPAAKAPAKAPTREETSSAASDALRKMLRRPR